MQYRTLGRTGWKISEVSFGAWAIGGSWGEVDDSDSMAALHQAIDSGVNFIDTADVYGNGRSERLIAQLKAERKDEIFVATKAGRKLPSQTVQGYSRDNLTKWIEESLRNLKTDSLDLVQLHCPPTDLYYHPEVFASMDDLQRAGKIQHYGVSVERVEEALKAIDFPNVKTVQIIFNCFRQRPAELLFPQALQKQIGILARVPLASGLLTGKFDANSKFDSEDHRHFNRKGEAFDVGEILRCGLRGRSARSREDSASGSRRRQHGPICFEMDSHARGRQLRNPGREEAAASLRQQCRFWYSSTLVRGHGRDRACLQQLHCRASSQSLVDTDSAMICSAME